MCRIVCVIALFVMPINMCFALELVVDPNPRATAQRLNDSYNRTVNDCKEPETGASRGHYYCSGVTLRMVNDGPFLPWTYSPYALQTGATSWTWIRKDLSISVLAHPAGFVLNPPTDAQARGLPALDQGWTCIYTFDGFTGPDRNWYGCGPLNDTSFAPPAQPSTRNKNEEWAFGTCTLQNVTTAEQWKQKYPGGPQQPIQTSQCSWNAEVPAQWDAMIAAHEARAKTSASDYFAERKYFNEFMLKNLPNSDGSEMKRYIAAFIYLPGGTQNFGVRGDNGKAPAQQSGIDVAHRFQLKLYQEGYAVPILAVNVKELSKTQKEKNTLPPPAPFSYNPADQFVWLGEGSGVPRQYITSATWSQFTDNASGQKVWSLKVIPTARGKKYQADDRKAIYLELRQFRGADPQWRNGERTPGSMESQLNCIIDNYPGRADWNLEPFRPLVSDAEAKAAGCNPVSK